MNSRVLSVVDFQMKTKKLIGCSASLAGALFLAAGDRAAQAESTATVAPAGAAGPSASAGVQPVKAEKPFFAPYGVFKPTVIVSNGVESFGQLNQSSINAAVNPALVDDPEEVAYTFQVAQSRFGMWVGGDAPVRAQLEIDFLHTDISSPTTGAYPRLRLAQVEWTANPSLKLVLGQGNDVFAPLAPYVYNLTSAFFTAGNSGSQRQQGYALITRGSLEIAAGLGLPGTNNNPALGNLERHSVPHGVLRVAAKTPSKIYVGAAIIGTTLAYSKADASPRKHASVVGNAFAEAELGGLGVKAELYGGQNTANIGLNTLGSGRYDTTLREVGGFLSAKYPVVGPFAAQFAVGGARILNNEDVSPAYSMDPTTNTRSARSGLGIEWNAQLRVGLSYTVASMTAFVEPFLVATRHSLIEQDLVQFEETRRAAGAETGFMYKF